MTARLTLRTAVLAAVAAGAVLVPSAAAFADASPRPSAPAPAVESTLSPEPTKAAAEAAQPTVTPRGGVAAGDRPATATPEERPSVRPRGGVAAGERPGSTSGDDTTALVGSAAGALLLAVAGTFVVRRRSAAHRNG